MKEYTYSEKAIMSTMAKLGCLGRDVSSKIELPCDEEAGKFTPHPDAEYPEFDCTCCRRERECMGL